MGLRVFLIFSISLSLSFLINNKTLNGMSVLDPFLSCKIDFVGEECFDLLLRIKAVQTLLVIVVTQAPFLSQYQEWRRSPKYGLEDFSEDFVSLLFNGLFSDIDRIDYALFNFNSTTKKIFPVQFMANIFEIVQKIFYVCNLYEEYDSLIQFNWQEFFSDAGNNKYLVFAKCIDYVGFFLETLWQTYQEKFIFSDKSKQIICLKIILDNLEKAVSVRTCNFRQVYFYNYKNIGFDFFEDMINEVVSLKNDKDFIEIIEFLFNQYRKNMIENLLRAN